MTSQALVIKPADIGAVRIGESEWLDGIRQFRYVEVDLGSGQTVPGFEAIQNNGTVFVYGLASAITAIRTRGNRIRSADEVAALDAARAVEAVALFERQHRTDQATYDKLMTSQKALCGSCRVPLAGDGRIHYDSASKKLLGSKCSCSPYEHVYA